jgi:archaellum component FlaC
MNNEITNIHHEIKDIKEQLHKITILLEKLDKVDEIINSSKKLDRHIDFVENTYESLLQPLNYMKNTINRISGNENKELISLKNK